MRLDEGWNQIQFNLSDFTRRAYGESFPERHTFPCPISLEILNLTPPQAQITSRHSASRFTRTVEYGGFTSLTVCTRKMSFRRSSSFSFPSRFVVVVNFFPWFLNIKSLSQKSGLHVNRWAVKRHVFWNSGGQSRTRYSLACWDFIYMYVFRACIFGWHFHGHLDSQRTNSLWNVLGKERWKLMCPSRERYMAQCYRH